MVNDPNNPDHAAVEIPGAVTVPDGILGYAKAGVAGAVMVIGTIGTALGDGSINANEVGAILTATIAAIGLVAAVGNKTKVVKS